MVDKLKYWCYKVLPLVYDDSLSYYEVLCKVVKKLNDLIDQYGLTGETIREMQTAIAELQKWVDDFDTTFIESVVREYLATMIFVEISDSGYFVYYIPENWDDIKFQTTGLDVDIPDTDYGRLVLNY